MAKQPQRDYDQAKKPDGAKQPPAPPTPKPGVPNMSIDEEDVLLVEEVFEEDVPVVEAAPEVEEFVLADDDVLEAELVEAEPVEEDVFAEEVVEVSGSAAVLAEPSGVVEALPLFTKPIVSAPASDVDLMKMFDEEPGAPSLATPVSATHVEPPRAEHEVSGLSFAEKLAAASAPASEGKAGPASEVVAAHEEAAVVAAPASEVLALEEMEAIEEIEEYAEAAPASAARRDDDVLFDEALVESASEVKSGEVVEELVEEVSSATRKSEAVLDDEVAEADVASGAEIFDDVTEFAEPISGAVLDADEAEAVEAGSSAVLFEEIAAEGSAAKKPRSGKTKDYDQTVAFDSASGAKKSDSDLLVTEEELAGSSEASAVDLGDVQDRKGSSAAGIDKVAEALESGVSLDSDPLAKTVPSVEFDDLLDDDSGETKAAPKKKSASKKRAQDEDAEAIEEIEEIEEIGALEDDVVETKTKKDKKGKQAPKATGDDIDLDALFDEAEAVEADEAKAVEAEEADVAFDEEMEATEAFGVEEDDDKPAKKTALGKKTRMHVDEEEAEAVAEDEDDTRSKKKGKKDKQKGTSEKATVAPAPAQTSTFVRVFIGMILVAFLLAGGGVAGVFLAPDQVRELANTVTMYEPPPPQPAPKPPEPKRVELARLAIDQGKFQEGADQLKDAKDDPVELSTRGEAVWLAYYKNLDKAVAPDAENPKVKDALKDLESGKNDLLVAQIKTLIAQKVLRDEVAKAAADKLDLDKKLTSVTADKEKAEKRGDALAGVLLKGKFIDDKTDFDVAVLEKTLKDLSTDKAVLSAVNKILDKEVKAAGEEGLKEVLKIKKGFEDNVAAVDKALEDEKTKDKGVKGVLEIAADRKLKIKDRDDLLSTVEMAFKELVDGKIVEANADPRKQILDGVKQARKKAESPLSVPLAQLGMSLGGIGSGTSKIVEQSFGMAKIVSELGWFSTREEFIQTPEQKMSTYVTLLQDRQQNNPKALAAILREADWVRGLKSKADNDSRSKARYVQGLALRNEEKFAEAKTAFDDALKSIPKAAQAGTWHDLARKSYQELTDPNAYYLPRLEQFQAAGNTQAALTEANTALKAMPTNARLYAQRGLIRYELVRGKGAKVPEQTQKEIRADAETAGKDEKLAAESAYLVGLLEEELGNWPEAEKLYRQAIKMNPGSPDDAGRFRVALARLLLRDRPEGAAPAAPPAPADDEKKKVGAVPVPQERTIVWHPWSLLVISTVVGQPEEVEDKETTARLTETIKLADELIASKNAKIKGQGYLLKGIALSKMGRRTEGLKDYARGLQLIDPGTKTEEMTKLIEEHPAFQQPDASNTPNEVMAERHFGEGMHFYWSKQYPLAETQFRQAVTYFQSDARYQYYLGLALIHQKTTLKRDAAYHSFERGARLEAKMASTNPEAVREINASLERIQGELRQTLNGFRYKAKVEESETK